MTDCRYIPTEHILESYYFHVALYRLSKFDCKHFKSMFKKEEENFKK